METHASAIMALCAGARKDLDQVVKPERKMSVELREKEKTKIIAARRARLGRHMK